MPKRGPKPNLITESKIFSVAKMMKKNRQLEKIQNTDKKAVDDLAEKASKAVDRFQHKKVNILPLSTKRRAIKVTY